MPAKHYNEIRKLGDLMRDIGFCMLTTVDEDGYPHSRPMAVQKIEFDGDLWFFTRRDSAKTRETSHEHKVNVSFANPEKHHYVSVSGTAQCLTDEAKAKELWHEAYRDWFPKGLSDPEITLMKVTAEKAEYWDTPGGQTVSILKFLTGQSPEAGEHEKVDLTQ